MIQLEWPWILLLAPLGLVLPRLLPPATRQTAALYSPVLSSKLREIEQEGQSGRTAHWGRLLALMTIWSALLLAAGQPRWIGDPVALPTTGRDLMLAVDLSESMLREDMAVGQRTTDRLTAVKQVLGEFITRRENDRLGLILFGSQAYLQTPLTFDRDTLRTQLQEAQSGFAGPRTAIGDAIGIAVKRLRKRPADSRVLILLTDGANTAGKVDPIRAAELAAELKVRIHTIGVGAEAVVTQGLFGRRRVNPSADLDESLLKEIARRTGGEYFRARDPKELEGIYRRLDELEPIEQTPEILRPQRSLIHWPLGAALALASLLGVKLAWPRIGLVQRRSA